MRKITAPIALAIFGLMFTSIVATQATPTQSKFYACVKKSNGAVRIVAASKKCLKTEKRVGWNVSGIQGPQGAAGIPGAPGADGQDGIDGINGVDGTNGIDGGYEVMLNPSDFATYSFSTLSDLEQFYLNSLPRSAWVIQHADFGVETILASFPTPSSWAGSTTAKITIYWMADNNSGVIKLFQGGAGNVEGDSMTSFDSVGAAFFDGTPNAQVLYSSEAFIPIGTNPEFIDVAIQRYMNGGVDTNTGNVMIFGAKVEPVFP
jgi:hypothetical protein